LLNDECDAGFDGMPHLQRDWPEGTFVQTYQMPILFAGKSA
jgi:hypothetical protein